MSNLITFDEVKCEDSFDHILQKQGIQTYSTKDEKTKHFIISLEKLYQIKTKDWEYGHKDCLNRKVDKVRVFDIKRKMEQTDYQPRSFITFATVFGFKPKIIDGQHRIESYFRKYEENENCIDIYVPIILIQCKDKEEVRNQFKNINNFTPAPKFYLSDDKERKECAKYIANQLIISINKRLPNLKSVIDYVNPSLDKEKLMEKLYDDIDWEYYEELFENEECDKNKIGKKFFEDIDSYNRFLKTKGVKYYPLYPLDNSSCESYQHKKSFVQCKRAKLRGNRCGYHENTEICNIFDRKEKLFENIEDINGKKLYFLMYCNYEWISEIKSFVKNSEISMLYN